MILLIFFILLSLFFVPPILYFKKSIFKSFYHDFLGWHVPDEKHLYVSHPWLGICKHCGKEIRKDNQGNWF